MSERIGSEVLYEDLKDGIEEKGLGAAVSSDAYLRDETTGTLFIEEFKNLPKHDGYMVLLEDFSQYIFQDFGNYLKTENISEDDIDVIIIQYNSNFVTYEKTPGFTPLLTF